MFRFRALRHLFSWIVSATILAGALTPMMSHGQPGQGGKRFHEVCTAKGMQRIPVQDDAPVRGKGAAEHKVMQHCLFCVSHSGTQGLPPPADFVLRLPAYGGRSYPPLYFNASRPLFAWMVAQPRAPPAFSI